ncbi:MAG: acyl-CoA dehydrogenase [Nannocystaceae bacterium]
MTLFNRYVADLRDVRFLLFEQFRIQELLGEGPFVDWERGDAEMVIDEFYKWARTVLGPLNSVGDAQGCRLVDGEVITPDGFREAWRSLYAGGWRSIAVGAEYGGQAGPYALQCLVDEMIAGANTAFGMYPGITHGAAEVIAEYGTPEQKEALCKRMFAGEIAGTMCLTEPHAGSDVGANSTLATPIGGGKYRIQGTKIFISGGSHDLAGNVIHLVLARTAEAPRGTRGLSLFIVPRDRLDGGGRNDVAVTGLERKMGMKASATCVLTFGANDECIGELLGTGECQGIMQMFRLMNFARIAVGIQGLSIASSAYLNALAYAKERTQGASFRQARDADAPRVPIIEHADVRRMLLDMKSRVEGLRALSIKLTTHADRCRCARGSDPEAASYHQGQLDLLVPLLKAYGTDQAFQVCATAMQVYGGAGYMKDHPIEQSVRDAKIFSIYEGTNHIQALDLVGRKLGSRHGANFQAFVRDVSGFLAAHAEHPTLADAVARLKEAVDALSGAAMQLFVWSQGDKVELVPLSANRFLEMMAETVVGWLLLDGAAIAERSAAELPADHADRSFYAGRVHAARYFASQVLPGVAHKAALLRAGDTSPLEIPTEAFATL